MDNLTFLAKSWFVIPWLAIGLAAASWVHHDLSWRPRVVAPTRWAWPVVVAMFSLVGLGLYLAFGRRRRVASIDATLDAVAGDGLGILCGMLIARIASLTFWEEFWLEAMLAFSLGWISFQMRSAAIMTRDPGRAISLSFGDELLSLVMMMAGVGAVTTFVTPQVVGALPGPTTYAFWGFAVLALLAGAICTLPMAWMMVQAGWKPGRNLAYAPRGGGLGVAMGLLAAIALVLPAWLTQVRLDRALAMAPTGRELAGGERSVDTLRHGLGQSLATAERVLAADHRASAMLALDGAMRAARVGAIAAPEDAFDFVRKRIQRAYQSIWQGHQGAAIEHLAAARASLNTGMPGTPREPTWIDLYAGAPVINSRGAIIGEVLEVEQGQVLVALGGVRNLWGFVDLPAAQQVWLRPEALLFGPRASVGQAYVAMPTLAAR
jgi:hypothetical protein